MNVMSLEDNEAEHKKLERLETELGKATRRLEEMSAVLSEMSETLQRLEEHASRETKEGS